MEQNSQVSGWRINQKGARLQEGMISKPPVEVRKVEGEEWVPGHFKHVVEYVVWGNAANG
jgi:hypothetical protein